MGPNPPVHAVGFFVERVRYTCHAYGWRRGHTRKAPSDSIVTFIQFVRRDRLLGVRDEAIGVLFHLANQFVGVAAKAIEVELQSAAEGLATDIA